MSTKLETEPFSYRERQLPRGMMKANVFHGPRRFGLEERPIPTAGPGEAVMQVRLTTICGTDIHIVRGEYPVRPGLIIGHEAMGVIHELGAGVTGYQLGQRVLVGAITPCGQCEPCLMGDTSQCGGPLVGWRLGNTIDGAKAEYMRVPYAQANLAVIPDGLSDEDVLLLSDIASTGLSTADPAVLAAPCGSAISGMRGVPSRGRRLRAVAPLTHFHLAQGCENEYALRSLPP